MRETDRGRGADVSRPSATDVGEVVSERVGVTGAVAAEDRGDPEIRQVRVLVQGLDLRIAPIRDLAQVYPGENRPRETQVADAANVKSDSCGRQRPRDLEAAAAGTRLSGGHRGI